SADYVVVLLSPDVNRPESDTQRSSFVLNEIEYAQNAHKPIIPVMAIKTRIPVQLAGIQYIDITGNLTDDAKILKLLQELAKKTRLDSKQIKSLSHTLGSNLRENKLRLNEPCAIILAAIITGVFALLAALIASKGDNPTFPMLH